MKALKYTILSILLGGAVSSCNFLDKEPGKLVIDNYFNTPEEANSFLTGVYAALGQSTFYGADYLYLVGGDDLEHYGGTNRSPNSTGLICNNATSSDAAVTGFWYTLYSGINRANIFLENIDRVSKIDAKLKAQYTAEARFLRAFYYFNLVQCWGDVPFRTSSTSDVVGLDAPRVDKQKIYDFIVSEMDEISNETTGGLLTASELNYQPGRISKSAAWGILASVYLFRAGEFHREGRAANADETKTYYEQAAKYAKKVVELGKHTLAKDYWDFFIDLCADRYNSTATESIWEIEFAGNNTSDVKAEGRIGNIIGLAAPDMSSKSTVTGSADPGFGYEFIFATPKLYKLYGTDINAPELADPADEAAKALREKDARYYWNIAPFKYVEDGGKNTGVTGREFYEQAGLDYVLANDKGRSYSYGSKDVLTTAKQVDYARACSKFRREYEADKKDKNSTAINFPALRYSDVLLMLAEAENEVNNGPTADAEAALYAVRERAGLKEALPKMSKGQFLKAVKDERARELCFEYTRHFDLIRWGELVSSMNPLAEEATNGVNSGWKQGPVNVHNYFRISEAYNYFPIPEAEMAVNKAITQNNPGW